MVLPGIPHHVTQRGNRREQTFFEEGDYALYLDLLADAAGRYGIEIWSYCLMPNHVHIIAVPRDADSLSQTFRHVHRHYTGYINARLRTTGHLCAALRYVALNPVRARLVERADDWRWSSVRAHFAEQDDHVVQVTAALARVGDFRAFLGEDFDEAFTYAALRKAETIGRPVGSAAWLEDMVAKTGQQLLPGKRGPKPKVFRG